MHYGTVTPSTTLFLPKSQSATATPLTGGKAAAVSTHSIQRRQLAKQPPQDHMRAHTDAYKHKHNKHTHR